jgi:hypothetical protein
MTTLIILLNATVSPLLSGILALGIIYLVMVLGGKVVKNHISPKVGKAIIGFGYIAMVMAIIGIISIIFSSEN